MKFLCNTEFIHSGKHSYFAGNMYSDITAETAQKLIALDRKKPLGALSFFTPVDEDAVNFIKSVKNGDPPNIPPPSTDKPPTRIELIAEAKDLGIKGADRMTVDELKEAIAAKKAETGQKPDDPASGGENEQ